MAKRLLIVDDSRVSRMIIKGKVASLQPDWEVLEAASGDEAVQRALDLRPDHHHGREHARHEWF